MPIVKLPSGSWQAKLTGRDGRTISATFETSYDAEEQLARWKRGKRDGTLTNSRKRQLSVEHFFNVWLDEQKRKKAGGTESGWLRTREQQYKDFVHPVIGSKRLIDVTPANVQRVVIGVAEAGRSSQLQVHVFNLIRTLFRSAIEIHHLLAHNPAIPTLKPEISDREAPHLSMKQVGQLIAHVTGRRYGLAISTQFLLGLRCGELQALTWDDLDLEAGWVTIRRTYIRKTRVIRDYPKGKRQHRNPIPPILLPQLIEAKRLATCSFVASDDGKSMLSYEGYHRRLKGYCNELGLPEIGTHGLRHSTSEFYMAHGATTDDLQELFAHSSQEVTRRYMHGSNSNLVSIVGRAKLRLVPRGEEPQSGSDGGSSTKNVHEVSSEKKLVGK